MVVGAVVWLEFAYPEAIGSGDALHFLVTGVSLVGVGMYFAVGCLDGRRYLVRPVAGFS